MNNFVFGNADPLLYSSSTPRTEYTSDIDIKRQLDHAMQQYQQLQQSRQLETPQHDWLGDFDNELKSLDQDIIDRLSVDQEFNQLNASLQQDIQLEIMSNIKWKINSKQESTQKIKRLTDIISQYKQNKANEDKKQMSEIADYLQNYSDMTFNEYKKMKENK